MSDVALRTAPIAIVGRDRQLGELAETFAVVRTGNSCTVLLGGDAGVGKTTVVEAFCTRLGDAARVVRGQSVPLGGDGLAYVPIITALRELRQQVGDAALVEWAGPGAGVVGRLLPELAGGNGADDPLRLFEAVAEILEHAAARRPLVVVLEDLHWADASTRHLIAFLARALTDAPVLIVATYRSDELHRRHPLRPFLAELQRLPRVIELTVPRLDRDEVAVMLAALRPERADAAFVDEIHRRSDGIPFFVEELAGTDCCDLPTGLRDVLIIRFESLTAPAQAAVRLLAVAGNQAEHDLIAGATELDTTELATGLREAVDAQLLIVDGTAYRFRHALLREAVLEDLLPGEAAALHKRLAETIEGRTDVVPTETIAVELAHHWLAARDLRKAFTWSLTAARDGTIDKSESLRMYERALELWDQVEGAETLAGAHAELLEAAADVATDAGELSRGLALTDAALEDTDASRQPLDTARLLQKKGHLLSKLNRFGSVETIREAVALVPEDPPSDQRADVLAMLAAMHMMAGEVEEAIEASHASIAAAGAAGAALAEASARITLATCLGGVGRLDQARAEFAAALAVSAGDERTMLRHNINLSDVLRLNERYREAADTALAGTAPARAAGLRRTWEAMLAGNAAEPMLLLGEWATARRLIDRALDLDPPSHHRIHLKTLLALHQVWTDDLAAADQTLAEFRPWLTTPLPSPQYLTIIALSEAEWALAVGDPARAWAAAKASLDNRASQNVGSMWWMARAGAEAIAMSRRAIGEPFDDKPAEACLRAAIDDLGAVSPSAVARALIEAELRDDVATWQAALGDARRRRGPRPPRRPHPSAAGGVARQRPARRRGGARRRRRDRRGDRGPPAAATSHRPAPSPRARPGRAGTQQGRIGDVDTTRAGGVAIDRPRPEQRRDRRRAVHQHEDGQRPRLEHPRQARRQHAHGSGGDGAARDAAGQLTMGSDEQESKAERDAGELDDVADRDELRNRYEMLLQELRVVLPGVQVLMAFLLTAPFAQRFGDLDDVGRETYLVALIAALGSTICLMAPTVFHRVAERTARRARLVWGVRLAIVGIVLLAVALVAATWCIIRLVFGTPEATVVAASAVVVFVVVWVLLPAQRRPHLAPQQTGVGQTFVKKSWSSMVPWSSADTTIGAVGTLTP